MLLQYDGDYPLVEYYEPPSGKTYLIATLQAGVLLMALLVLFNFPLSQALADLTLQSAWKGLPNIMSVMVLLLPRVLILWLASVLFSKDDSIAVMLLFIATLYAAIVHDLLWFFVARHRTQKRLAEVTAHATTLATIRKEYPVPVEDLTWREWFQKTVLRRTDDTIEDQRIAEMLGVPVTDLDKYVTPDVWQKVQSERHKEFLQEKAEKETEDEFGRFGFMMQNRTPKPISTTVKKKKKTKRRHSDYGRFQDFR
jgi:hypothetical protein